MNGHLRLDFRRDIRQIFFVVLRQNHGAQTEAVRRQQLFLHAADGQHLAAQVISPVMATSQRTGMRVSALTIEVQIVIPAEGPSLGIAPSGTCM
jgi:hypothetical protein